MKNIFKTINACRICGSVESLDILNLGEQPPANSLYKVGENSPPNVPLRLVFCEECSTVQLGEDVDPEYLFSEYLWTTGTSDTALKYSEQFAEKALNHINHLANEPFVIEVASNDGTFLARFQEADCKVLGVDPATNIADIASKNGIPTEVEFFSESLAQQLLDEHEAADIVYARNVIPHVKEVHSIISGIGILLRESGVGIIEFHNAALILEQLHYDYIYHEHLFYYTLTTINCLLKRHDLYIFDISESPISGGSWVVYFSKQEREKTEALISAQNSENESRYNQYQRWAEFSESAKKHAEKLTTIVRKEVQENGKIVAYGASARSSTLLNYCGLNSEYISVVIDKNPLKHGLLTAGSNIPIISFEEGLKVVKSAEKILLLAWNFQDEIVQQLRDVGFSGQFIIPLPGDPHIL